MRRILCLIDGLGFGGAQRQIIGLTYLLKKNGYYVSLASYHERDFYHELLDKLEITPIQIKSGESKFSKMKAVRDLIVKERYDTVISYIDGPNMIVCLIKLIFRDKFKLLVSDRITTQVVDWGVKVRYWLYRQANYIVPNSYSQEKFIKRHFPLLENKIHTITNFTDTSFFSPAEDDSELYYNLKILVAGRIDAQKNIPRFLEAMAKVKEKGVSFHVKWYGNVQKGTEDYFNRMIQIRDNLKLEEEVEFNKGTSDIRSEYQNCDVFCLPSLYEGFPNVVCEAMSCGKPILASEVCDNPLLVRNGYNGFLFNPLNSEELAELVEKYSQIPMSARKEMGRKSREMAVEQLSEEVFVNKYINLIEN